jgi:hypothetical protein
MGGTLSIVIFILMRCCHSLILIPSVTYIVPFRPIKDSQFRLSVIYSRKNSAESTHRGSEEVLTTFRHHERTHSIQLDRLCRILREQAGDVHLLALAQLTQDSVKADSRPDKVALVGPLALNEGEATADGALVADE